MTVWTNLLSLAGASLIALAAVQAAAFAVGRRIGRVNVVDVAWGVGFVVVAFLAALFGDGAPGRRWLLFALVAVWGVRLSVHMHVKSRGKGEDPRYRDLLERAGGADTATVVLRVFAIQGAAQWFVSLPVLVSAVLGPTRGVGVGALVGGVALWAVGVVFEAVGDRQLLRFTSDPAHHGRIIDTGLWAWTRHPNYFGDACVWWGLWLVAASVWPGALTVLSPLLMTYFLVHATGARLLEKTLSQRPGYRAYQERTAFFVPRPPRR
ncbi:DUF1295 domain-containing protein [Rhodococcus sp. NPDC003318]|uniref:DUF1295 domain-containing protein n=1 Tax=Rhodococcus sp. NPDC003318 TaxID=3364503 RepID=UPI0036976349